uniref:Testis expressed 12 n=1 Tax=Rattus norvegicus TaxID=10116 RepID=A0ABK0LNU8_RAT
MPLSESQCGKGPFYFLKTPSWKKKAGNKRKSGSRLIGSARLSRGSRAACWEPRPRRLRKEREALTCCDSEEAGRGGIFDCEWGKRPQLSESPQVSSLGKSDSSLSECSGLFYKEEALEKDLSDMSKEINLMLSTYAKVLSERAAVDASYIDEIDGLFKEANIIENFLVQKREFLKQRFTVITNTLHK